MARAQNEPDFIVIRAMPGLPDGWMPEGLEGRWYDRRDVPDYTGDNPGDLKGGPGKGRAWPTGRLETREDGAVAEVWEIGP